MNAVENSRIVVILAPIGGGKSVAAREIARRMLRLGASSLIVLDPFFEEQHARMGVVFDSLSKMLRWIASRRVTSTGKLRTPVFRAVLRSRDPSEVRHLWKALEHLPRTVVLADELGFYERNHPSPEFATLVRAARHWNVRLVACSQRPADVPKLLIGNAQSVLLAGTRETNDMQYIRGLAAVGKDEAERLAGIDPPKVSGGVLRVSFAVAGTGGTVDFSLRVDKKQKTER